MGEREAVGLRQGAGAAPAERAEAPATPRPAPAQPATLAPWQAALGPRPPAGLLAPPVQAKLEVGAPDDPLEREADAVAEAVVSGGEAAPVSRDGAPALRRTPGDVTQANQYHLTLFLSSYEGGTLVPPAATQAFLTNPATLALNQRLRDAVLANRRAGRPPLTISQLYSLALTITSHQGTALLLCHNVTKAFARGSGALAVQPLGDSEFFALFSRTDLGASDSGDWYHYFVVSLPAYYRTAGTLDTALPPAPPDEGLGTSMRRGVATGLVTTLRDKLRDPAVPSSPAYEGWLEANAISFAEGATFGHSPAEVLGESLVHLYGAQTGVSVAGGQVAASWPWYVPLPRGIADGDSPDAERFIQNFGRLQNEGVLIFTYRIYDIHGRMLREVRTSVPPPPAPATPEPAPTPPPPPPPPSSGGRGGGILRKAAGPAPAIAPPSVQRALAGQGQPLDGASRALMEPRLGADLGHVRVHADAAAGASAREIGALAYTYGSHIVFAPGQHQPATSAGRRLLAHELAHVVQQGGGGGEPTVRRQAVPSPAEQRTALLAEFRSLYERRQRIVSGEEPVESSEAIESRLVVVMGELQRLGIQRPPSELYQLQQTDPSAITRVTPVIVQSPAADQLVRGQRVRFQAVLSYIPPGRQIRYAWRWQRAGDTQRYQFFSAGDRSGSNAVELDDMTWNLTGVETASAVRITAQVYLGEAAGETAGTRFLPIVGSEPSDVHLEATTTTPVVGQPVEVFFREWTPRFQDYSVEWYVARAGAGADQLIARDQPRLRQQFDSEGSRILTARIYRVRRGFLGSERAHYRDATLSIEVLTAEAAGRRLLDGIPPDQLVSLRDTEQSIVSSIASLRQSERFGGELAPNYRQRREAQERRLADLRRHVPEAQRTLLPLPDTLFQVDSSQYDPLNVYTRPVPAVLTLPSAEGAQPLNLHFVLRRDDTPPWTWHGMLIDLTSGDVTISTGSGDTALAAYNATLADWSSDHAYPRGGLVTYQRLTAGGLTTSSFRTTNARNTIEAWVDGILIAGGVVLLGLSSVATAGSTAAAAAAFLGPIFLALGTARSVYAIYQNVERGSELFSSQNAIEAVGIAANFIGLGGSTLRRIGLSSGYRAVTYRVGSYAVLTGLALDAGTLVYVSAQGVQQLQAIRADPTLDDGQKAMALIRLMSQLITSGTMFILSNRDLFSGGLRRSDFLPTDTRATARAAAEPTGRVELEPGQRLDIGLALRRAGDTPDRLRALAQPRPDIGDRELVDRFNLLPWMQRTLTADEMRSLLPRLNTDTLVGLSNIPAREAHDLATRLRASLQSDDLLQALVPALGGARLRDLEAAVGIPHVSALHTAFGPADLRALIDGLEVARIRSLLDSSTAMELRAFAQADMLGLPALRNLGSDLNGAQVRALVGTHGAETVRWAAGDLAGNDVRLLLSRLEPAAAANLRDITGREALLLLNGYQPALLNRLAPTVPGSSLLAYFTGVGPDTARGRAQRLLDRGRASDIAGYAANLGAQRAAGGALANPPPVTAATVVADANYMNRLSEANQALANGTPVTDLTVVQRNALMFQSTLTSGSGAADIRLPNQAIAEHGIRPGAPSYSGLPINEASRTTTEYQNLLRTLETAGVGGGGPIGAADRGIVADVFVAPPAPGRNTAFVTADERIFRRLAALGGNAPSHGMSLVNSFPNGVTVTLTVGGSQRTVRVIYIRGDQLFTTPPVL